MTNFWIMIHPKSICAKGRVIQHFVTTKASAHTMHAQCLVTETIDIAWSQNKSNGCTWGYILANLTDHFQPLDILKMI